MMIIYVYNYVTYKRQFFFQDQYHIRSLTTSAGVVEAYGCRMCAVMVQKVTFSTALMVA